uniref:NTGP4 n=1 Tax=Solanum tuberosum TaxID=4113 RepID=M1DRB1_SOLTU
MKLRNYSSEVSFLLGDLKQGVADELKEQLQRFSFKEQQRRITEIVESKMNNTMHSLENSWRRSVQLVSDHVSDNDSYYGQNNNMGYLNYMHMNGIWIEEQSKDTHLQKGTKRAERMKKYKFGDRQDYLASRRMST